MLAQTELLLPDEGSVEEETGAQLQALPDCVLISERHPQKPFVGLLISAVGKKLLPPSSQTRNSQPLDLRWQDPRTHVPKTCGTMVSKEGNQLLPVATHPNPKTPLRAGGCHTPGFPRLLVVSLSCEANGQGPAHSKWMQ